MCGGGGGSVLSAPTLIATQSQHKFLFKQYDDEVFHSLLEDRGKSIKSGPRREELFLQFGRDFASYLEHAGYFPIIEVRKYFNFL